MLKSRGPKIQLADTDVPVEGPVLVAFDFDGTLTVKDSFLAFLEWRVGTARYLAGLARLAPALAGYLIHRDRERLKVKAASLFLKGLTRTQLEADAAAFATEVSWSIFRPDALRTWRYWRSKGARVVIVTASPETTVAPFARALGAHRLIGTQLAYDADDRVTGAFATPNCRGPEKVARLKAEFGEDVELAAAYGDTAGDREMLGLASERGYRVFSGKPARA